MKGTGFPSPAPPTTSAGRTLFTLQKWTTDPWILETVVNYKLELMDTPMQNHPWGDRIRRPHKKIITQPTPIKVLHDANFWEIMNCTGWSH